MKIASFLLLTAVLIRTHSPAMAQKPPEPQRPPDGGTREVLVSILIPSLPNAPFTATVNTEWIRQLADGSTIRVGNHRIVARDKAGRVFQERRLLVPNDGNHESGVTQIEISDPISHKFYICVPRERVCQLELFSPPTFARSPAAGSATAPRVPDSPGVEDLGKQSVEGLETVGARETSVIDAGAIGNDSPILTRREYWYSSQLGLNLISKLQDPRIGIQNFEVSDITLGEPDAKLFELPEKSKVIDLREPSPKAPSPQDQNF